MWMNALVPLQRKERTMAAFRQKQSTKQTEHVIFPPLSRSLSLRSDETILRIHRSLHLSKTLLLYISYVSPFIDISPHKFNH